ncbi:cold-shock protein [Rhizobium sp. L1K21]|uniref:cold-shock protein n=1 Tax=Rhizobium sp. L1K21 TaxID=2954933 RepID=UPI002093BA2E|nr:cold-shock protein [Rhizobium sp. L1K21]MCO6186762.1 cold-shock protein [Rhizobium sp. L1K21]
MTTPHFHPGDLIVLKPRTLGRVEFKGSARIVAVQPAETHGHVRYRVRLDEENFDRTVAHDDIEAPAAQAADASQAADADGSAGVATHNPAPSWVNINTIRTRNSGERRSRR